MNGNIEFWYDEAEITKEIDEIDDEKPLTILKKETDFDKYPGETLEIDWRDDTIEVVANGVVIEYPKSKVSMYGELPKEFVPNKKWAIEELIEELERTLLYMGYDYDLKIERIK